MSQRMAYVSNDGGCVPFDSPEEMIDIIMADATPKRKRVSTLQKLNVQGVIADAINERGGKLYTDNGETMDGHITSILAILGFY